jgi:uncharacterized protein (DUF2249 family)
MAILYTMSVQKCGDRDPDVPEQLAAVLAEATLALGRAGRPAKASHPAAAGYAAVRRDRPDAAQRLNAAMHVLARLHPTPTPSDKEHAMPDATLDVRTEPPARRHQLIFETFDGLTAGDGFELVNDHDPKPLYYQLEAEQTGRFSWQYLEEGPEVWRVRIGRTGA